jgi:ribonucleoside-diphosphate reductase alpha chain
MDAFSIAISIALQHGVPLRTFVEKYSNMRFEPAGMTDDPDIRFASSLIDFIFRRLAVDYLPLEERMELGILAVSERMNPTLPGIEEAATESTTGLDMEASYPVDAPSLDLDDVKPFDAPPVSARLEAAFAPSPRAANADAPYCMTCGVQMQRAGSCHACPSCGSTSGCS